MSAKAKQEAEIIPPDKDDSATAQAGAHLRMPPFIDHEGGWRGLLARFIGAPLSAFFSVLYRGGKNLIGGLVYRLTLIALVGTALAVTGYGIYQARHMALPQFDSFWHTEEAAPKDAFAVNGASRPAQAGDNVPSGALADLQGQFQALNAPDARAAGDARQAAPSAFKSSPDAPIEAPIAAQVTTQVEVSAQTSEVIAQAAQDKAALTALKTQYAALQEKYTNLLASRAASQNTAQAQAEAEAQQALQARMALGDLLLRLDSGAAYDDLLEGGALARVLRRSEWSLLALYADSGVPTRPALLTRFELWVANSAAPDIGTAATENPLYDALLAWLRARGDGLVRVRAAPLATADGDIALIATALERGRYDEASWRMGALLRRLESDRSINHPDTASLQLLYDDTRAAAELSPMLAALRDDYMAGVRP